MMNTLLRNYHLLNFFEICQYECGLHKRVLTKPNYGFNQIAKCNYKRYIKHSLKHTEKGTILAQWF